MKPSGFQFATEKSFSFHGPSVTAAMIDVVNQRLATQVQYVSSANKIAFHLNNNLGGGHYYASMNHDCQKYHEEDIVAVILDAMEDMGWQFRFQYDTESSSSKLTGDSITSRELFLFHKVKIPTYVSAVLHKPNKEALTGLVFQPGLAGEGVAIQSIKPNSLASMAFPSLKPGMEIISINEYTPTTPEGVASTLKSLAGDITITAKLPN